jgi:hypothetical protein
MMMVCKILILILCNYYLSASERIVEFDLGYDFYGRILFESDSNNLYYTLNQITDCELEFFKYNYVSEINEKFKITIPEVGKYNCANSDGRIFDFKIKSDTLIIRYGNYAYLYKFESNNTNLIEYYDLLEIIVRDSIDKRFGYKLIIENNKIIGYLDSYNEHTDANNNLFFWSYNYMNNKLDTISILQPKGYRWTMIQPKNIVDYYNGILISCDLDEDNLYFVHSQDSISKIELDLFKNDWSVDEQFKTHHPSEFFDFNKNNMDFTFLIHSINFLNENNILVKYSIPKTFETELYFIFNFCLLSKIDNEWSIIKEVEPELLFGNNKCNDKYNYGYYYNISNGNLISKHIPNHNNKNIMNFIRVEDIEDVLERIYREYNLSK